MYAIRTRTEPFLPSQGSGRKFLRLQVYSDFVYGTGTSQKVSQNYKSRLDKGITQYLIQSTSSPFLLFSHRMTCPLYFAALNYTPFLYTIKLYNQTTHPQLKVIFLILSAFFQLNPLPRRYISCKILTHGLSGWGAGGVEGEVPISPPPL